MLSYALVDNVNVNVKKMPFFKQSFFSKNSGTSVTLSDWTDKSFVEEGLAMKTTSRVNIHPSTPI